MEITTYHVTHHPMASRIDPDAKALVDYINDAGYCNGDNRSWNAMRSQVDALIDIDTQRRLGIAIAAESTEAEEDC